MNFLAAVVGLVFTSLIILPAIMLLSVVAWQIFPILIFLVVLSIIFVVKVFSNNA